MQHTPLDHAARVLAETDPARRYHAAKAAAKAAAAPYEQAAEDALQDLIAQHGGNEAAAARELGKTKNALYMRKKRATERASGARAAAPEQVQPALRFDSPRAARDAVLDWALRQQEVTDQQEVLFLGALAAGADPVALSEDSGVGLDTLRRIRPGGTSPSPSSTSTERKSRRLPARPWTVRSPWVPRPPPTPSIPPPASGSSRPSRS